MSKPADLNRCLAPLDQDHTIIAVIEMSQSSWLVAGVVPGIARHPLKKLAPDQDALLKLLHRWREEAGQAGRAITRIAVAFEAGRDGFWLAAGSGLTASKLMSFTRPAWPSPASIGAPRPTGSTPPCSSACSSAGCGASRSIVTWSPFRPWRKRMPGAPPASARAWWASAPGL